MRVELGYLRSPPALSAGPHMENQASNPLGTDVCWGCAGTWPTHDALQPQVIHTWNRGRENFAHRGGGKDKKTARGNTLSRSCWHDWHVAKHTKPERCSSHGGGGSSGVFATFLTQTLVYTSVIDQSAHEGLQDRVWYSIKSFPVSLHPTGLPSSTITQTFSRIPP